MHTQDHRHENTLLIIIQVDLQIQCNFYENPN